MKTPREKYLNDNMYRKLVDMMVDQIDQCNYTPSEMREAAVLASIIYEGRKPPGNIKLKYEDIDYEIKKIYSQEELSILLGIGNRLPAFRFNESKDNED